MKTTILLIYSFSYILADSARFVNSICNFRIYSAEPYILYPESDCMSKRSKRADAQKQPLPDREIQYQNPHEKTAQNLPETGELPIITLAKEIPASEIHDM